jgi:membrane protease YdiL (CAAX protease family)
MNGLGPQVAAAGPLAGLYASGREMSRRWPAAIPLLYLAAIALAEGLTALANARVGLLLHALILFALLLHGTRLNHEPLGALLWALALAPLIRILSLCLPLAGIPLVYWYAIIGVPVCAATAMAARALGYSRQDLGLVLKLRVLPLEIALLLFGFGLGLLEYLILRPQPLTRSLTLAELWLPALVLTASTGFQEEVIFRGLLQQAALRALGAPGGLLYVSALFAVMHIGYLSLPDAGFVFTIGLLFAALARRQGSVVGVSLAHTGVNVGQFLVWPFVLPAMFHG